MSLIHICKAAWQMAAAAVRTLGRVDGGVVVTKYHHVKGDIPGVVCCEGGHPVPDEGSFAATQKALELVQDLTAADDVLFLLSGGGSALFEKTLDVYKRQLQAGAGRHGRFHRPLRRGRRRQHHQAGKPDHRGMQHSSSCRGSDSGTEGRRGSVSYTHLDVYKRQQPTQNDHRKRRRLTMKKITRRSMLKGSAVAAAALALSA